jgi:hypothetical protein
VDVNAKKTSVFHEKVDCSQIILSQNQNIPSHTTIANFNSGRIIFTTPSPTFDIEVEALNLKATEIINQKFVRRYSHKSEEIPVTGKNTPQFSTMLPINLKKDFYLTQMGRNILKPVMK